MDFKVCSANFIFQGGQGVVRRAILDFMQLRNRSPLMVLAVFIIIGGNSCSGSATRIPSVTPWITSTPTTYTLLPATSLALQSSPTPTITRSATETSTPTEVPFPTAQAISTNVVAFIVEGPDYTFPDSLWVANVDGSGEKQLVANIDHWPEDYYSDLQWSPDGKWISFLSRDGLWLVTPDGATINKVLNFPDLLTFKWSPDSSQIAYVQASWLSSQTPQPSLIGILNIKSGSVTSSFDFDFQPLNLLLTWVFNGKYLLLNHVGAFVLVDPSSGRVVRELQKGFLSPDYIYLIMSPNNQWFALVAAGTGTAGLYFGVKGIDGNNLRFNSGGSTSIPVWNSAGNVLYYATYDLVKNGMIYNGENERLLQFDARTQQLKQLISLGPSDYQFVWSVTISPDGRTLETHSEISEDQVSFIILDLNSPNTVKYIWDIQLPHTKMGHYDIRSAWSSDSEHIVFLDLPDNTSPALRTLYALNSNTGKLAVISGVHVLQAWAVSHPLMKP